MLKVECPHCDKGFKAPEKYAGKKVRCKGCQEIFRIPAGDDAPAPRKKAPKTNAPQKKKTAAVGAAKADSSKSAPNAQTSKPKKRKKSFQVNSILPDIAPTEMAKEVQTGGFEPVTIFEGAAREKQETVGLTKPPEKSKMPMVIGLIAVLVLLVGGGGFFALQFLGPAGNGGTTDSTTTTTGPAPSTTTGPATSTTTTGPPPTTTTTGPPPTTTTTTTTGPPPTTTGPPPTTTTTTGGVPVSKGDFRNVKWGMTKQQVMANETAIVHQDKGKTVTYKVNLYGQPWFLDYKFENGKLTFAKMRFQTNRTKMSQYLSDYDLMKAMTSKEWGKAKHTSDFWASGKKAIYPPDKYGTAVAEGHLTRMTVWETKVTNVTLILAGGNFDIQLEIEYRPRKSARLPSSGP